MASKEHADMLAKMLNADPYKMALYSFGHVWQMNSEPKFDPLDLSDPPKREFTDKDIAQAVEIATSGARKGADYIDIALNTAATIIAIADKATGGVVGEAVKVAIEDAAKAHTVDVDKAAEAAEKDAKLNPGNYVEATGKIMYVLLGLTGRVLIYPFMSSEEPEITEPAKPPEDSSTPLLDAEDAGTTVLRRCMQEEAAKITKEVGGAATSTHDVELMLLLPPDRYHHL
jgi:hypothetical protein